MDNQSQPVSSSAQNKRASRNFGTTSAAFINSTSGRPSSSSRPRSTINEMFYQTPTTTAVEQPVVSRRPKEFAAKQKRQQVTNSVIYAPEDIEKLSDPQNVGTFSHNPSFPYSQKLLILCM